jgi:hypothetical protein
MHAQPVTCAVLVKTPWRIPCGFEAVATIIRGADVFGVCQSHAATAVFFGYVLTFLPQRPAASEPGS